jgi:glycosyltransferase involved in cell wall biosynthesis
LITKGEGVTRLAIVVSHPIQYYVPLYRSLSRRDGVALKVFFTWHAGASAQHDPGFGKEYRWDIPLTEGYDYELVANTARRPGSDRFFGIRTPRLVERIMSWNPDAVHVTGYAYASHLSVMRALQGRGVPLIFRGDSHLLDSETPWRAILKKRFLRHVYGWTDACLYVGEKNHDYYREMGVPAEKLFYCPHSIEVSRFSEPDNELEEKAAKWRGELGLQPSTKVLLYAGKFEARKQPIELMKAIERLESSNILLVMVGDGELGEKVRGLAASNVARFRVLPFQNQTKMPLVYRLADVVVLPSARGETWGLCLNEAMACGRRVLASDKVGGAIDLIQCGKDGAIFASGDWNDFREKVMMLCDSPIDKNHLWERAQQFDIPATEQHLRDALRKIVGS